MKKRVPIIIAVILIALAATAVWLYATAGRVSTDDAQVDGHVTPIAARVGGTVMNVAITNNQPVEAGGLLFKIDPSDYQVALDRARAELADAEAASAAAAANVPITSTTATGNVSSARGGVAQAAAGVAEAQQGVEAAQARLNTSRARQREAEANATKTTRDVERLRGLLAKDEVAQQQFDAAVASADADKATVDSARSQVAEAELAIRAADSHLMQARAGEAQASAQLQTAQTAPEQVAAMRARAAAAEARVQQMKAMVRQAELNLQYTTIKAPVKGVVTRKSVEPGQVVQPGQPLLSLVTLDGIWITANFKETQLRDMHPGQSALIEVDAYGGREFKGHVESMSAATGARFSLIPPDNATGNYVKVVQRVPVRIFLDEKQDLGQMLRPGLSVTATVYTK